MRALLVAQNGQCQWPALVLACTFLTKLAAVRRLILTITFTPKSRPTRQSQTNKTAAAVNGKKYSRPFQLAANVQVDLSRAEPSRAESRDEANRRDTQTERQLGERQFRVKWPAVTLGRNDGDKLFLLPGQASACQPHRHIQLELLALGPVRRAVECMFSFCWH